MNTVIKRGARELRKPEDLPTKVSFLQDLKLLADKYLLKKECIT